MAARFAFADVLKKECDPLLKLNAGISSFTCVPREKELIRPLLVTYGTHIRRKLDPECWINKIKDDVLKKLDQGYYVFITDVRYINEVQWIQSEGGLILNIQREGVGPANSEEEEGAKSIKGLANAQVCWPSFGDGEIFLCDKYIKDVIDREFYQIFKKELSA